MLDTSVRSLTKVVKEHLELKKTSRRKVFSSVSNQNFGLGAACRRQSIGFIRQSICLIRQRICIIRQSICLIRHSIGIIILFSTVEAAVNYQNDRLYVTLTEIILENIRTDFKRQKEIGVMVWAAVDSEGSKSPLGFIEEVVKMNSIVY